MKAYVICIKGHKGSEEAAQRCIESGKNFDVVVEKFDAVTPSTIQETMRGKKLGVNGIDAKWSKPDNTLACFLSHYSLWEKIHETGETALILEHDAVFHDLIPSGTKTICSFGEPSFGRKANPRKVGFLNTFSRPRGKYLAGAHAYVVTKEGARQLLEQAAKKIIPTDVFINGVSFPTLQEYYPWPVHVEETFSTVQKVEGCRAKYAWQKDRNGYKLSNVE
jgi:GR25 family glycosyltransferase involved in LPS biosynthesis